MSNGKKAYDCLHILIFVKYYLKTTLQCEISFCRSFPFIRRIFSRGVNTPVFSDLYFRCHFMVYHYVTSEQINDTQSRDVLLRLNRHTIWISFYFIISRTHGILQATSFVREQQKVLMRRVCVCVWGGGSHFDVNRSDLTQDQMISKVNKNHLREVNTTLY